MARLYRSFAWLILISSIAVASAGGLGQREANNTLRMPQQGTSYRYAAVSAYGELGLVDPMVVVSPPGDPNRLFVVDEGGEIIVIPNVNAPTRSVFLDISDRVTLARPDGEGGILGLAFHPNYANNGYFYVYYICNTSTADGSGPHDRLSRFTRSKNDPDRADRDSEVVLFSQYDEKFNHNGGTLLFGPDGYLYITLGDEGHPDDMFDNAQRIDRDFFSGVFRIDVDHRPGSLAPHAHAALAGQVNYWIPPDNPFVGATSFNGKPVDPARVRTEFWAVGLRSPWRMFYDAPTGNMYVSDVGEEGARGNHSEEIDLIVRGGNYGWPYFESIDPGPKQAEMPAGLSPIMPLLAYERGNSGPFVGRAAIGGVVYRGTALPELNGAYIFGDYFTGNIWMLRHSGSSVQQWDFLMSLGQGHLVSFGLDPQNGDILICDVIDDTVKRLVHTPASDLVPPTLADTGVFADLTALEPNPGIVPYDINVPFWSDGALKRRWFSVPDPNAKIKFEANKPWDFPEGTVWIKHFDLEMVKGDPATARRVETRLIVRNNGGVYGATYKWNDAQDNAVLVGEFGEDQTFTISDNGTPRQQTWHFPSRSECLSCHTPVAGHALGFNTAQLNRKFDYAGGTDNQIHALAQVGYFSNPANPGRVALVDPGNNHARLDARVRSYLAANCSQCHQPGGPGRGLWDARVTTPTARAGLVNGGLNDMLGDPANRVVAPRSVEHSVLLQRVASTDPARRMPPIASTVVDEEAVALLTQWINTLPARRMPLAVRVTNPKGMRTTQQVVTIRGVARGDNLARVVYTLNGGPEQEAAGVNVWSAELPLEPGVNTIVLYAVDSADQRSRPVRRTLKYTPPRTSAAARR